MPLMDTGNTLIWQALKLYLPPGTKLTSVIRPASDQLAFITQTARKRGYVFKTQPVLHDRSSWEPALTFLRGLGYKVAAPGSSNHQKGLAYDLAGPDLNAIAEAVRKAVAHKRITLVQNSKSNLLIETRNHCVHAEIEAGILDFEPFDYA